MATSLQLRDAMKVLTDQPIDTKITYGDIWEGSHYSFGFSKMQRSACTTCGDVPSYPYLNKMNNVMQHCVVEILYSMKMHQLHTIFLFNF